MSYWNNDMKLDECSEKEIKDLLIGRRIVSVDGDTMTLDNGTAIEVFPNTGCSGCGSGEYHIDHLATTPNAIMNVWCDCDDVESAWGNDTRTIYKIFVMCDGLSTPTEVLSVIGTDGNGYYGTGYELCVTLPKKNEVAEE